MKKEETLKNKENEQKQGEWFVQNRNSHHVFSERPSIMYMYGVDLLLT